MNYNLFVPGKPLVDNTLVIVEQLPGLIITTDVTTHLNFGYFPSYNRAYSPVIFSVSGTLAMVLPLLPFCRFVPAVLYPPFHRRTRLSLLL